MKLTIADRHDLRKYTGGLPCTLPLRFAIDGFQKSIEFTDEEFAKYAIDIDPTTFKITSNDPEYTIELSDVPEAVARAMKDFITRYDREETKKEVLITNSIAVFKKIVE